MFSDDVVAGAVDPPHTLFVSWVQIPLPLGVWKDKKDNLVYRNIHKFRAEISTPANTMLISQA